VARKKKPIREAVSTSRLSRGVKLGRLAAGVGARLALSRGGAALSRLEKAADRTDAGHQRSAEVMLGALGEMKGLALKLGQMVSYADNDLPAPYRKLLAKLQADAPTMDIETVVGVIEDQLGRPPGELFASFDEVPLAAASIGQVHRATLPDGREAVVKVQFPGIADAMRADIRNGAAAFAFGQLLFPHVKRSDLRDELLQVMLEECDYRLEADNQREFRELWKGHDVIVVPRVFDEFCTERVITTEFIAGRRFDDFIATASRADKNRAGYALLEFMLISFFGHGLFNGDPHPGNYIFCDDGTVAFLDFGCVKHIPDKMHGDFRDFLASTVNGDAQGLARAVRALGYAPPGVSIEAEEWLRVERYVQRPWLLDREFTFDREYVRGIWPLLLKNPEMRKIGLPREFLFFNRLWFGLYAILTDLHASGNFHAIVRDLLAIGHHPDQ
jgi:predicted unusual protein kinase regulating ubiquinone biosynthesis (AarF/ABC1/UbiB family)